MLITSTELIKQSWNIFSKNWKKFISYILLLVAPTFLMTILGIIFAYMASFNFGDSFFTITMLLTFLLALASTIFAVWITIALTKTVKQIIENEEFTVDWKLELSKATKYIWPIILTSIITTVLVVLGLLLFIIPGIIFLVWFAFSFYAVVLDDKKPVEAIKYSKGLVIGKWWKIFLRLILPNLFYGIIASLIIFVLLIPFNLILANFSDMIDQIIKNLINSSINVIATPLITIIMVLLYNSIKNNQGLAEKVLEEEKLEEEKLDNLEENI